MEKLLNLGICIGWFLLKSGSLIVMLPSVCTYKRNHGYTRTQDKTQESNRVRNRTIG
jgi:hypothetical protein